MRVPPLPAIEEVNSTHAEAEVAVGVHEGVHDSSHALSWVVQTLSAQKRKLPKSGTSYAWYVDGFRFTFCWKRYGVFSVAACIASPIASQELVSLSC